MNCGLLVFIFDILHKKEGGILFVHDSISIFHISWNMSYAPAQGAENAGQGAPNYCRGPLSFAAGNTYFMFFSYSSIIFLTIWPPTEPASREVRSPL